MRAYDVDLTVRIRCAAYSEKEVVDAVKESFRKGKYSDTGDTALEIRIREVT